MHTTLTDGVKGHIDEETTSDDIAIASGWAFHGETLKVCPLRLVKNDVICELKSIKREDVATFYKNKEITYCGWEIEYDPNERNTLEMNLYGKWVPVFKFFKEEVHYKITPKINKETPSFVVVDNFYEDPDIVREYALSCEYKEHPANHKGKRTDECFRFPGLKERFEELIGRKISSWDKYGTNGCFQYCIGGDQIVYHRDAQQYAGVLFLTPDAPPQSGTSFYRSIHNKVMKVEEDDHDEVFQGGFLDPTQFQKVDTVGNVYNRLVLFDSRLIHSGREYFGTAKENARLFQLFFFDLE